MFDIPILGTRRPTLIGSGLNAGHQHDDIISILLELADCKYITPEYFTPAYINVNLYLKPQVCVAYRP